MTDPARIIDISPEAEEAKSVALALPDAARTVKVSDYPTREAANAFFLRCREARKGIAAHYDPKIEEWKAAKKLADDNRAKMVAEKTAAEAPIVEAEGIVNREILRFDAEDKKRRDEEQRIAEEKARKEAEGAALRAAEEAERAGDKEEAEEIIKEAVHAPVFIPRGPAPPKLKGSAEVTNWKFEITDLKTLVLAVAKGTAPLTYLEANTVAIGATVSAQSKGEVSSFSCPGVRIWPDKQRKATGR